MQAVFMEQDGENAKSNNHYTWLNRLCESMKLSIGEVATLFDENENLRKQIDSLQHDKVALMEDVKSLQTEMAAFKAENHQFRIQAPKTSRRDISVDELTSSLDRTVIHEDKADKRPILAQVFQRRFEAMREELQDVMPLLAQDCSNSRLGAIGYAIRCADILFESYLAPSNTNKKETSIKMQRHDMEDSPKSLERFFESLSILDKHMKELHAKLRMVSATKPYFLSTKSLETASWSLMLLTQPPLLATNLIGTECAAAQSRAQSTIEVHSSEAMSPYKSNVTSFERTCAVLLCGDIPIAKSISGRSNYAGAQAFRTEKQAGLRFLNQSYWHEESLLLAKELKFKFPNPDFDASHAEIHLMTFFYRECHSNPFVHHNQISALEKEAMTRFGATIYVSKKVCDCCQEFQKALSEAGMNITLVGIPNCKPARNGCSI